MATLTVGITYYNEGALLAECLSSLLNQARPPEEIVVYDDASTLPPSPHLPSDARIRVIRGTENKGPAFGRNQILASAKCDFTHFHDADDWFDPEWSSHLRPILDSGDVDAVFTEVTSHRDGKMFVERVVGFEELKDIGDLVRFSLLRTILVPCGTYRTGLLREMGGYREKIWQSEDFDFHVRLAARQPKYRVLQVPLVHIRLRPQSRSQNFAETREYLLKAIELLAGELPEKYASDLAQAAAMCGSQLYGLGKRDDARRAFDLARKLGGDPFVGRQPVYRWMARALGPMAAEQIALYYRKLLPPPIRRIFR